MNIEVTLGCLLIFGALAFVAAIALWSRWKIDGIARDGYRSARAILTDDDNER